MTHRPISKDDQSIAREFMKKSCLCEYVFVKKRYDVCMGGGGGGG